MTGLVGLGKAHLATALGYAACLRGKSVLFANAIDVINTLSAAQNKGALKAELRKYLAPSVLLLSTGSRQVIAQFCEELSVLRRQNLQSKMLTQLLTQQLLIRHHLFRRHRSVGSPYS